MLRLTTLSPSRADTGIEVTEAKPSGCDERGEGGLDLEKPRLGEIDQVDLVDRQHDMPDAEQRDDRGVTRVCSNSPLRASTSSTASSALDAPVAMLRVYC